MAETQQTTASAAAPQGNAPQGGNRGGQRGGQRGNNRGPRRDQAPQEPKQFEELVINIDRVSRVVKGGRRFRFKALVVVGDRKNKVGVGVAKGGDVQVAVQKATDIAKKNLIVIPIVNETIPHENEVKYSGARVLLKPAAPGTGIIAGGVVRSVVNVTGIRNLISKSLGSTNKVNIAYATVEALSNLVARDQWLANSGKGEKKPAAKKAAKSEDVAAEAPAKKPVAKKETK